MNPDRTTVKYMCEKFWTLPGRITTHYSAAELSRLIEAANAVCEKGNAKPELVVLRRLSVS